MSKKFKLSFFSLVLIFHLSACKDEDIVIPYFDFVVYSPGLQDTGNAQAEVFDKTWRATAYIFPYEQDTHFVSLRLETYTLEGDLRDVVFFGNFMLREGSYIVTKDSGAGQSQSDELIYGGYGQFESDGDVINGIYEVAEEYDNKFYIDHIDTTNHTIEGRFTTLFKIKDEYSQQELARVVLFENGTFIVNY